jgi:3-oxoacyl-[acyl-carrier-protein] synthase II
MSRKRRAVITGLGIVSPIGIGIGPFWRAALAGRSGLGPPTLFDASKLPRECQVVGEVSDFDARQWTTGHTYRTAGRFSQFAVAAAKMAIEDSRLDSAPARKEYLNVSIGTSLNGQIDIAELSLKAFLDGQDISPWACLEFPGHAATTHVSIATGARGRNTTFSTACAAGLDAIGFAASDIRTGLTTMVIAGGTDTPLSPFILTCFQSVGVLSKWEGDPKEASRPFDAHRSGLVLAEGAAVVVVEEEEQAINRGAPFYARIEGFATASEGAHLRKVDETGATAARVMHEALRQANVAPAEIDFVCAHGNSMLDYDASETAAIKKVFGPHAWSLPISSIKSMCGQALAAGSAMQVVASCLSLRDHVVSPTINYTTRDPACDLDYVPNVSRTARIRSALIHAHSLGGSHAAMVLTAQH